MMGWNPTPDAINSVKLTIQDTRSCMVCCDYVVQNFYMGCTFLHGMLQLRRPCPTIQIQIPAWRAAITLFARNGNHGMLRLRCPYWPLHGTLRWRNPHWPLEKKLCAGYAATTISRKTKTKIQKFASVSSFFRHSQWVLYLARRARGGWPDWPGST